MTAYQTLIERLNGRFQQFPQVQAIALGGSLAANSQDAGSDIDLYVYVNDLIPLANREAIVADLGASRSSLNLQLWDLGDEWLDAASGIEIDVIYWWQKWIEAQLERVLVQQQGSVGYSTCFWHTVRHSQTLFDRDGWFAALQTKINQPYPEALRQDIIFKNHSVLRSIIPSYHTQLEKAVKRGDLVSVNHRLAGLFALNRETHPGEKRLLNKAGQLALLPNHMAEQVTAVLQAQGEEVITAVDRLLGNLDALLQTQGFDPATSRPG
ncbi:MAG: nucleotidyltransferase domain-containing protein [Chloroflexota bacterium]